MICPRCGSLLERSTILANELRCPACMITLGGDETQANTLDAEPMRSSFPTLAGFQILAEVGRGGMGIVYCAWQENPPRKVALKVLPPALAGDPSRLARFRREAELGAGLVDSHILPVHAVLESGGVPVIVMPFIDGSDLSVALRTRRAAQKRESHSPHPWALLDDRAYLDQMLPVLDQLIGAVRVLHEADILHRDIKPSNALVDAKGNLWLSDFGVARLETEGLGTQHGSVLGTQAYMAPEQASGDSDLDRRADLFSLGATLYQALTLHLPFGKQGAGEDSPPPQAPSRRQPLLSHALGAVLLKALELDRTRRYSSAAELQADWQKARQGTSLDRPRGWRIKAMGQFVHANPLQFGGGLVLVLAALVGLLWRASDKAVPVDVPVPGRVIYLDSEPEGAEVVLVPLDPNTGEPIGNQAIYPNQVTPVTIENVPPGEYLVEALIKGRGFHEVYRTVPRSSAENMLLGLEPHRSWKILADHTVRLPTVFIPSSSHVLNEMALFIGRGFVMGRPDRAESPPHPVVVADFWLDAHETTRRQYRGAMKILPNELRDVAADFQAVSYITFHEAVYCAERMGRRLPSETEYEYAATDQARHIYPWGDNPNFIKDWPSHGFRHLSFDFTSTRPAVYGLFSGVAEWTASRYYPWPEQKEVLATLSTQEWLQAEWRGTRVVRGGPESVVMGKETTIQAPHAAAPAMRFGWKENKREPGLGFRMARSRTPRYLAP